MSSDKGAQTALTIREDQVGFTEEQQQALLNHAGVSSNAKPADVEVFFHQVKRTGLDPFAKQIYMIERMGKQTIQTGIDGFRLIARRAVNTSKESLGYEDTQWADEHGQWHDVWPSGKAPLAARVTVLRNGQRFPAIALYDEYVATKRDGTPNAMWAQRPAGQLAKCAEALALRKAFPQDLSGLYSADEMQQADNDQKPQAAPAGPADPADPWETPIGQNIQVAWDDIDQLRKVARSLGADHPLYGQVANRGAELKAAADSAEAAIEDAEIVEDQL